MAKRSREVSHDSSDDDEAPEAVSFGISKKAAKGAQDALHQHHTAQKQKQKEKNRAIDRALKDRSASTKRKGKAVAVGSGKQSKKTEATLEEDEEEESEMDDAEEGVQGGPSRKELEERMARAMMEAEDESGSEEEEFAGSADDVDMDGEDEEMSDEEDGSEDEDEDEDEELLDEEQSDEDEDEDEEMESEDDDEEDDEDEDVPSTRPSSALRKDGYLPDHLFKSALSNAGKKIVFDNDAPLPSTEASPPRKRKRTKRTSKDVLLGSRTIRTLPKTNAVVSSAVTKGLKPPRRVDKFVKTSLNLKGNTAKARSKGWNRQPAHLGVMKRHGPAAHFVRAT